MKQRVSFENDVNDKQATQIKGLKYLKINSVNIWKDISKGTTNMLTFDRGDNHRFPYVIKELRH